MQFEPMPFAALHWDRLPVMEVPGETGTAYVRGVESGNLRVRMVQYSPGYLADHWCERGHAVHVLDGSCTVEVQDGRRFSLEAGMSFYVGNGVDAHRLSTETGCTMFIVD